MARRGGRFAAGFSQGLAQAMTGAMPLLIQQQLTERKLAQDEEELKLRKQAHEAQQQLLGMKAEEHLQRLLIGAALGQEIGRMGQSTVLGTEEPGTGIISEPSPDLARRSRLAALMARGGQTKEAMGLMPELTEPSPEMVARRAAAGFGAIRQAFPGLMGGEEQGAPPEGAAPAGAAAPPAGQMPAFPRPISGVLQGGKIQWSQPVPTFTVNKDGTITTSVKLEPVQFDVKQITIDTPEGAVIMERWIDPRRPGGVLMQYPIGRPVPPETLQRLHLTVEHGYGIPKTMADGSQNPFHWRILGRLTQIQMLPPQAQAQALKALEEDVVKLRSTPEGEKAVSGMGTTARAIEAARGEELSQEEEKVRRVEKARAEAQPLTGTAATRYEFYKSAQGQLATIRQTYNPAFVGKGFEPFIQAAQSEFDKHMAAANRGKYTPGAYAGGLREWLGIASAEEVTFRRAVLDVSDTLLRARSGAQINEQEARRLAGLLFQVTDSPKVFEAAIDRFDAVIKDNIKTILKAATKGAGELLKEEQQGAAPGAPVAPAPAKPAEAAQVYPRDMIVVDPGGVKRRLKKGSPLPQGWRPLYPDPGGR